MSVAIVRDSEKRRDTCTVWAYGSCHVLKVIAWRFVYGGEVHLDQIPNNSWRFISRVVRDLLPV